MIKNKETFPSSITLNNIIFPNNATKLIIPAGILSHRQWHSWRRNLLFGSQTSQAWWFWHRAGSGLVSRRQQALAGLPDNWEHNFLWNQRDIYFQNWSFLGFGVLNLMTDLINLRMSMRCSRGSGLLVRDTNLERHVAANNCEYEDCKDFTNTVSS